MIQKKTLFGNIHSGWKGTFQEIARRAVRGLKEEYRVNPENLICCIGPHIKQCCFEVEEDVRNMFYKKFKNTGRIEEIIKKSHNNNKYYIDTGLVNRLILKEEGMRDENIIDSMICTKCNSEKLHSYRDEGEFSGRNTALIALKSKKLYCESSSNNF